MPTTYCPSGHAISYTAAKPEKCPRCGTSMQTPSVSSVAADLASLPGSASPASHPAKTKWPKAAEESEENFGEYAFDKSSIQLEGVETEIMTVAKLRERKDPVERTDPGARPDALSTSDLVGKMLAAEGVKVEELMQRSTGSIPSASPVVQNAPAIPPLRKVRTPKSTRPRTPRKAK